MKEMRDQGEIFENGGTEIFGTRSLLGFIYKGAACTAIGMRSSQHKH